MKMVREKVKETEKGRRAEFFGLLAKLPGRPDKETVVGGYTEGRTTHLSELSEGEYRGLIGWMRGNTPPAPEVGDWSEGDMWRKRVMGAIGGWLAASGRTSNAEKIKAIALRAAAKGVDGDNPPAGEGGYKRFNAIPVGRLRSLYYAFNDMKNDVVRVRDLSPDLPEQVLREELAKAIAEEAYERCAAIKKRLMAMDTPPAPEDTPRPPKGEREFRV